jgi:hypothetical protein
MSGPVMSSNDKGESLSAAQLNEAEPEDRSKPEDAGARFPKTNKEYFRMLLKSGLICSAVIFLILFVADKLLAPQRGKAVEEFARSAAISLLAGFNLALMRLRWLKGRDR